MKKQSIKELSEEKKAKEEYNAEEEELSHDKACKGCTFGVSFNSPGKERVNAL